MSTAQLAPRRTKVRKSRQLATRPVAELLLEITYLLHARKVVSQPRKRDQSIAFDEPLAVAGQQ